MKMGHISKIQAQLQKLGLKQGTMEATPQALPATNGGAVTTKQIVAVFTQSIAPRMIDGLGQSRSVLSCIRLMAKSQCEKSLRTVRQLSVV
jgi:hypothetical protein